MATSNGRNVLLAAVTVLAAIPPLVLTAVAHPLATGRPPMVLVTVPQVGTIVESAVSSELLVTVYVVSDRPSWPWRSGVAEGAGFEPAGGC